MGKLPVAQLLQAAVSDVVGDASCMLDMADSDQPLSASAAVAKEVAFRAREDVT